MLERLAVAASPGSGAVVMGTGIVSIGLSIDGQELLSRVLLAVAALVWVMLGVALVKLALRLRPVLRDFSRLPGALTAVAGTDVLGTRLSLLGWNREAVVLLALATALWLVLVPPVLTHWRRPTVGVSFLLAVATESISVLAGRLAGETDTAWLGVAGMVFLALGLVFYLFVLATFDLRQLLVGSGDHWVSGGALAIATLACARCAHAAASLGGLHEVAGALDTAALVLLAAAVVWLPALVAGEVVAVRAGYDERRWSTVFPLGMYAVCSFAVADLRGLGLVTDFARAWIWIAFAAWVYFFGCMLLRLAAGGRPLTRGA